MKGSRIITVVHRFLRQHHAEGRPLCVAVSGGADSLALLMAVRQYCQKKAFDLHCAHVDHGWRSSSSLEAAAVGRLCAEAGATFHLRRLEAPPAGENLEAWGRQQRYAFFRELAHVHHLQAVLLGHHADDQAETVLKRLFEGASLAALPAMQPVTSQPGLTLWRPLLTLAKPQLLAFVEQLALPVIDDPSNQDPKFLRTRLRRELIPLLEQQFGKAVARNLVKLAEEAQELKAFVAESLQPYLDGLQVREREVELSLAQPCPPFVLKQLLRRACAAAGQAPSREALEDMARFLRLGKGMRRVALGHGHATICGKRLFLQRFSSTDSAKKS